MDDGKKERLLTYGCLLCAVLTYAFVCIWYVSVIFAILTIIVGICHNRLYRTNKEVRASFVAVGIFIGFAVLVLFAILLYYGMIGL